MLTKVYAELNLEIRRGLAWMCILGNSLFLRDYVGVLTAI